MKESWPKITLTDAEAEAFLNYLFQNRKKQHKTSKQQVMYVAIRNALNEWKKRGFKP